MVAYGAGEVEGGGAFLALQGFSGTIWMEYDGIG